VDSLATRSLCVCAAILLRLLSPQVFQKNWSEAHEMFKAKVQKIKKVGIDSQGNVVPDDDDDDVSNEGPEGAGGQGQQEADHTGWVEAKAKAAATSSAGAGTGVGRRAEEEEEEEAAAAGDGDEPAPYETLAEKTAKLELGKKAVTEGFGVSQDKVVEAGADGAYEV